ncbi:MAG: hypothetical protein GX620_05350 [Chloroflexi bacterium]|nr:hypothetical protein [Chloroflexota bacterium]
MSSAQFTARQRRLVLVLVMAIIVVFSTLTGFIVTSLQGLQGVSPPPTVTVVWETPTAWPTTTAAAEPEEDVLSQVQAARLFYQIAHQVESVRGLVPRSQVPLSFLGSQDMAQAVRRIQTERDPQSQLRPYMLLGLFPEVPVRVRIHSVVGMYVPEQRQLYIATERQGSDVDNQALLARAYAHALLDQTFDFGSLDARATTTDARLATRALVEGDATLLTSIYLYDDPARVNWDYLATLISENEWVGYGTGLDSSATMSHLQRFPYWEGPHFALALYEAGGWEVINRAYTDPPRTTEQVLHPERYLLERDNPGSVNVPDLSDLLGEGWTTVLEDTMGELVVGLYLAQDLPQVTAWQAADGWDGDKLKVFEHPDGQRVTVWRTGWDSRVDATEMEQALVSQVPQRFLPVVPVRPVHGLGGVWWRVSEGAISVSRAGRYVTLVRAPDLKTLAEIREILP